MATSSITTTTSPRNAPSWIAHGWSTIHEYAKRVWDNSGEDNIFFLASGIAFNLLLAIVPFVLLFATALTYLSKEPTDLVVVRVAELMDRFLPARPDGRESAVTQLVVQIVKARGAVGLYSAIGFVWFSTRLFGSLRSVLCSIFDIEQDRGAIEGKIFDVRVTVLSSLLLVVYTALSAYLAIATTRGVSVLADIGLRQDVMGQLEYSVGRILALVFIIALFYGLYKYMPNKRMRWQTALLAAGFTGAAFEAARFVFGLYARHFRPGSMYSGTVAALVVAVSWVYYAAVVFILGGEVAQVYELRRTRRLQNEAFEE